MADKGYTVSEETRPGSFRVFYWAPEQAEAEKHAECIRPLFPNLNIVVRPDDR